MEPPSRIRIGSRPKACLSVAQAAWASAPVGRHQIRLRAVARLDFQPHGGRTDFFQVFDNQFAMMRSGF